MCASVGDFIFLALAVGLSLLLYTVGGACCFRFMDKVSFKSDLDDGDGRDSSMDRQAPDCDLVSVSSLHQAALRLHIPRQLSDRIVNDGWFSHSFPPRVTAYLVAVR